MIENQPVQNQASAKAAARRIALERISKSATPKTNHRKEANQAIITATHSPIETPLPNAQKKRRGINLNYCEYDLSTLRDTHGGFILNESNNNSNDDISPITPISERPIATVPSDAVENFAIKKWGSLENLDKEFERRGVTKQARKKIKYEAKMKELRKATLTSVYIKLRDEVQEHVHEYGDKSVVGDGLFKQKCLVLVKCSTLTAEFGECYRLYYEEFNLERVIDIYELKNSSGVVVLIGENEDKLLVYAVRQCIKDLGVYSANATLAAQEGEKGKMQAIMAECKVVAQNVVKIPALQNPSIEFILKAIVCNLRASTSFLFVSKAIDVNFVDNEARATVKASITSRVLEYDQMLENRGYKGVKNQIFS
ncbi:hypothetical protein HK100_011218 [Physocladia obscura]|uniref:Uncharacterized protein n=1 Tax=Physocladia obscura TaxID=109957 RepID=A0AAD5T1J6_9FUNG|nr:hypothetical protein HK100_011218 [Physocladia obscura]